jgi:hypothetical protein
VPATIIIVMVEAMIMVVENKAARKVMSFSGRELRENTLAAKIVLNVLPVATGKAKEIDAIALGIAVGHLERRRAIRMNGAAAKPIRALPLPAQRGRYGTRVH